MTTFINPDTGFPEETPCSGCGWPRYCCLCPPMDEAGMYEEDTESRALAWGDLTAEQQAPYLKIAEETLAATELLYCTRTWEAWGYGTMSAADFSNAAEDADLVASVAETFYTSLIALTETT